MVLPTGTSVTAAAAGALLLLCFGAARAYRHRAARAVGGDVRVLFFSTPELVADAPTPHAAVVIDVLRATTTITCALRCGAEAVQVFAELDALEAAAAAWPADRRVRAGERGGRIVQGFELDNSPAALSPARVEGRRVLLSTTNGTRALQRVRGVPLLLAACLPNRSAVASLLLERGAREVWIVGSGWEGAYSLEDSFCAGAVAAALIGQAAPGRVRCGNDEVGACGWWLVPLWNCSSPLAFLLVSSHSPYSPRCSLPWPCGLSTATTLRLACAPPAMGSDSCGWATTTPTLRAALRSTPQTWSHGKSSRASFERADMVCLLVEGCHAMPLRFATSLARNALRAPSELNASSSWSLALLALLACVSRPPRRPRGRPPTQPRRARRRRPAPARRVRRA
jgi:2-phosphosulfolactate phosphatase